jgi:hypothetical protein
MRFFTKELLTVTAGLIGLYLVVVHYTGVSKALAAGEHAYVGGVKALQGR